uniref:Uncharacterized protein n=1 Tax=Arundo donax TaxID=35708 RepID=A0A0A9FBE7_ARUDO
MSFYVGKISKVMEITMPQIDPTIQNELLPCRTG